ncbi:MAG: membrane-binding protein [Saprospiraceae bacterium]
MKRIVPIIFLLVSIMISCIENSHEEKVHHLDLDVASVAIPDRVVHKSSLNYDNRTSIWSLNNEPFTGYMVSFHQDSTLKEKAGILDGKKQNQFIQWYPDGKLKQVAHYHKGKLHGEKKLWSTDPPHILITHLNYHLGKAHGEQKQWYPTGELYKKLNMNMGKEEGIQQAFRKNGDLYANYEAKEGRIFGLKKAALCYGLEDENIKYEK